MKNDVVEQRGDPGRRGEADDDGARQRPSASACRGRDDPSDHHAIALAASAAGSTIADVSFVATARPAATPASGRPRPAAAGRDAAEGDHERQR